MHVQQTHGISNTDTPVFVVLTGSSQDQHQARLLIESLRAFGGPLHDTPVWIVQRAADLATFLFSDLPGVDTLLLEPDDALPRYFFASKVLACAQVEKRAAQQAVRSLVWMNPYGLILNPPMLLALDTTCDAAFRPVHIKNIGCPIAAPIDGFWKAVYDEVGLADSGLAVESYLDAQRIRPYYNSHLFAIDPGRGILRTWLEHFKRLVSDAAFQGAYCQDTTHQVFLHQAVLSALLTQQIPPTRLRSLPPDYSYPLHFHHQLPADRQAATLNRLICPVFEEPFRYPETLNGLAVDEPLASWLAARSST
ncbi:MAG: hypothetical protein JXB35_07715 [Anaerolineae bacterium]|nr:hypothetical protein [Anaerolineae bacterium]